MVDVAVAEEEVVAAVVAAVVAGVVVAAAVVVGAVERAVGVEAVAEGEQEVGGVGAHSGLPMGGSGVDRGSPDPDRAARSSGRDPCRGGSVWRSTAPGRERSEWGTWEWERERKKIRKKFCSFCVCVCFVFLSRKPPAVVFFSSEPHFEQSPTYQLLSFFIVSFHCCSSFPA